MVRGKGIKRAETISEGMPCVRYGEIYTTYNTSFTNTKSFIPQQLYSQCNLFHTGDLIFTLTGENKPDIAKAVAYLGESPVAAGGDLAYWTYHKMNPLYLAYFMASPYCIEQKRRLATGDIIVHISTDKVGSFLVPVPPKAEQDRIVAKLQEIEPLLQEYDRNEQKVHLELKLFPEQFKKSILQMAVQGKLVPQDPDDEPASVLLERIRTEKERLIKEGKIKRDKNESVIYKRDNSHYEKLGAVERCIDDEIPFDVPDSWAWVRLSTICKSIADGDHQPPPQTSSGIPFLVISDVSSGHFDFTKTRFVPLRYYECLAENRVPEAGDLLFTVTGSYGIVIPIMDKRKFCFQRHIALLKPCIIDTLFLATWLSTPLVYEQCRANATGTAQKTVGLSTLRNLLIPIPPKNEQKRIMNKLNHLVSKIHSM